MTGRFAAATLETLVCRILSGEAVFLIGAGFSLDSEGNSAKRLVARLMARFAALTELLAGEPKRSRDLREGLRVTFGLGTTELGLHDLVKTEHIEALAKQYYYINEWICSAFAIILDKLPKKRRRRIDAKLTAIENSLLEPHGVQPVPWNIAAYAGLNPEEVGKTLFLDTMGFLDRGVMSGMPRDLDPAAVEDSYHGILCDRHHVLARLAREGLCTLYLTTNYDLLVEGACRLSGFDLAECGRPANPSDPTATYRLLARIGGPTDFSASGAGVRSALLVKIHGCAERYRDAVKRKQIGSYLPSMVFTYREVQNWRKDSWSRDFLSTLLRTRTIVLSGYSVADPVLHDTFRTVYEEALIQRNGQPVNAARRPKNRDARAFFTGGAENGEFHGIEVLRAASRAAGFEKPPLNTHPNYIPFYFRDDTQERFQTLDESMLWVFHRAFRGIQLKALDSDLRRIVSRLLPHRRHESEFQQVRDAFRRLCRREYRMACRWDASAEARWAFRGATGWTGRFHPSLLREFALAETPARSRNPSADVQRQRAARYYYPVLDQPGWAAWGAVIEMAIRNAVSSWSGSAECTVDAASSNLPAVFYAANRSAPTPSCLVVRPASSPQPREGFHARGVWRRCHEWLLQSEIGGREVFSPGSAEIWEMAVEVSDRAKAGQWLGESNVETSAAAA
jgi:hypothetical protein